MTSAGVQYAVAKVFVKGTTNTDRIRYRITKGKRKLIKKYWDSQRQLGVFITCCARI
jgi:hypothetical protein